MKMTKENKAKALKMLSKNRKSLFNSVEENEANLLFVLKTFKTEFPGLYKLQKSVS
jgi:hypothetical protein